MAQAEARKLMTQEEHTAKCPLREMCPQYHYLELHQVYHDEVLRPSLDELKAEMRLAIAELRMVVGKVEVLTSKKDDVNGLRNDVTELKVERRTTNRIRMAFITQFLTLLGIFATLGATLLSSSQCNWLGKP